MNSYRKEETKRPATSFLERLAVPTTNGFSFVRSDEIDWIEAADYYLKIHVKNQTHLIRETLANLETLLDPDEFIRIHRSTIVRVDRIQEIQPFFDGGAVVLLHNGVKVKASRGYRSHLNALLKLPL